MCDSGDLKLYTVEQVATLCQVSVKTVYRAIWQGRLRACQLGVGAAYRVTSEDLQTWIEGSPARVHAQQKAKSRWKSIAASPRARRPSAANPEGRLFLPEEMEGGA